MIKALIKYKNRLLLSQKFLLDNQTRLIFLFILFLVTFIIWRIDFNFYYMDEWDWLKELAEGTFNIWTPHSEHFLPIMKLFYFLQINILEISPLVMHFIMLILHTSVSFTFGYFLWLMLRENILSIAGTFAFMLHPFQWENVLWNFQSQIILNVELFLISLIFLKLFIEKKGLIYYYSSLFFIFFQAYCFGNGLILPLLIIVFYLLFKRKKLSLKFIIPYIIIFIFNLTIYKLFGSDKTLSHTGEFSMNNIPSIVNYFLMAIMYNISRPLTFIGTPSFKLALIIFGLFFLFYTFILIHDFKTKKKYFSVLLFCLIFYLVSFVLISITRFKMGFEQSFSYRYAYYYLIPIILLCLSFIRYLFLTFANKKVYQALVISSTLIFSILATYRILYYKSKVESRNRFNYQEIKYNYIDKTYDPNFSLLHPYFTKDEILQTSKKLNLIDIEDTNQ